MSLTLVIFLLILGLILMLLEVLVLPGIGVAGIAGGILMISAVYGGYTISGVHGHVVLGSSLLSSGILLYLAMQRKTWDRISLHTELSGKSSVDITAHVKAGDKGESVTRLNPSGKAVINGQVWEVSTHSEFLPEGHLIEVIEVEVNKIFVKSAKTES